MRTNGNVHCAEEGKAYKLAEAITERFAKQEAHKTKPGPLDGINFWSLKGIESPDVMRILGNPHSYRMPLHKMVNGLRDSSKYDFWRAVFENHAVVQHEELLKVWYTCYLASGKWWVDMPSEETPHLPISYSRQELAESVITHPLLIDNWTVRCNYIKSHKPGWRFLRCIERMNAVKQSYSARTKAAIDSDDVAMFEMCRTMEGFRMSFHLLFNVITGGNISILRHLLSNNMLQRNIMSLNELCCLCAAQFPCHQSVPLLSAIEETSPGVLKSVQDDFGRNLLWYVIHNPRTIWFHPNCKLTSFLIEKGCDPDNRNQIGLSWREVTDGLSMPQKLGIAKRRYRSTKYNIWWISQQCYVNWGAPPLSETQPLESLYK